MTIAGKISLGGSVALSLGTAVLAFLVSGTKAQFATQLRAVEEALRSGKFPGVGFQYTGDFTTDSSQPAASVVRVGDGWETADTNMKSAQSGEKAAKEELVEAKAKNQELSLQSDKLQVLCNGSTGIGSHLHVQLFCMHSTHCHRL